MDNRKRIVNIYRRIYNYGFVSAYEGNVLVKNRISPNEKKSKELLKFFKNL